MIVRRNAFGQLEPAPLTASDATPQASPATFYLIAVAAGVTVFLITRWLDASKRKR